MTHKVVAYSAHAVVRMRERRISRLHVRRVLAVGARSRAARGRWIAEDRIGGRDLIVIYVESATALAVITAMWRN